MIAKFTELRVLATLRRIAKAMERANQLEEHRQSIEYPRLRDPGDAPAKKVVFFRPKVEE
jgi:hypothetical protein